MISKFNKEENQNATWNDHRVQNHRVWTS
jgi:hypothetical protein